jgi:hypothetical protein
MALPKMQLPLYNVVIPSTGKEVKFRPFLVKEEKALLIAQQSEDQKVMVNTLKSIILDCIQDPINVDSLAMFDYEYLFTQIRSKSVGEIVDLVFLCDTCEDEKARTIVHMDITKFKVNFNDKHTDKIQLTDSIGLKMKYPNIDTVQQLEAAATGDVDAIFDVVAECIEFIYDGDEVYPTKEQTKEEVLEFLNNLTQDQFAKIQEFFDTMPKMSQPVQYDCPVCGKHHDKVLEGLASFF